MSSSGTIAPSNNAHRNLFAADIFQKIGTTQKSNGNLVFSPASIQTCLVLAALAADGATETEMRNALRLGNMDQNAIATNYLEHIQSISKSDKDVDKKNASKPEFRMANRIFVNNDIEISKDFNELATKYFLTQAESVNFNESTKAANLINRWVEGETNNKIKNLINADSLGSDTSVLLINAIYFKATWLKPFSKDSTHKADFHVSQNQKVSIDMMMMDERVKYVDLPEYQASAVELKYANTDLTMLIVLPSKIDGLAEVEAKVSKLDLNEITNKMNVHDVDIFLPKFRIESELDLKPILEQMGMKTMFSDAANFSRLISVSKHGSQRISEVRHKAFLDVNEAGSEAAAATFWKIVPMSLNLDQKTFKADHPFLFFIRSRTAVYFSGRVTFP